MLLYGFKTQKQWKTEIRYKKMVLYGTFVCYLIVVFGATMLSRNGYWHNNAIQPFISKKFQPVYVFEVKLNGNATNSYIPAVR